MSLKEACFKSLVVLEKPVSRAEVTKYIIDNNLHDFKNTQKPTASVSSELGKLSKNDIRVGRTNENSNVFLYYLTKNEDIEKYCIDKKIPIENDEEI
jgi:hypothetical protein